MTIVTSPGISNLGAWLEQLVAESTGKEGKGLIPIDRETLAKPDLYGSDRIFVYVRLTSAPDLSQDAAVDALERDGALDLQHRNAGQIDFRKLGHFLFLAAHAQNRFAEQAFFAGAIVDEEQAIPGTIGGFRRHSAGGHLRFGLADVAEDESVFKQRRILLGFLARECGFR